jgi:hypothetical protein
MHNTVCSSLHQIAYFKVTAKSTMLQYEQLGPDEWRQLGTRSIPKVYCVDMEPGGHGGRLKSFRYPLSIQFGDVCSSKIICAGFNWARCL